MCACQKFMERVKGCFNRTARSACWLMLALLVSISPSSLAQDDPVSPVVVPPLEVPTSTTTPPIEEESITPPAEAMSLPDTQPESDPEPDYWGSIQEGFSGEVEADSGNSLLADEGLDMLSEAVGKMVMGLSIVLAMILVLYFLVRRFGRHVPALSGLQLGQVMGQVHLTRSASLHYVKSGGRVLVIGVNDSGMNLVAEFDEAAFEPLAPDWNAAAPFDSESFVQELKEQSASIRGEDVTLGSEGMKDDEISALRGDINRLQDYLQEENREQRD